MSLLLFSNNASTTLAAAIISTSTNISVVAGSGALFPNASPPQYFTATLQHLVAEVVTYSEIVTATSAGIDSFNIVRGKENTTPIGFSAGDVFALLPTAGDLAHFVQPDDAQSQGFNYANDVGAANAYSVTLTPALTGHVVGMPIRWKAGHTNTGGSTFNDGFSAGALTTASGAALSAVTVIAGGMYVSTWDGTKFQLAAGVGSDTTYLSRENNLSDVANVTTALENIGGNNASNINEGTLAYAQQGGSRSLVIDGYEIAASGRIRQWGYATATGSSPITVTFPIPFPHAALNIQATSTGSPSSYAVNSGNASQFQIVTEAGTVSYFWEAIGW